MSGIVGRDAELGAAEEFLGRLRAGPAGLVLYGPPGIGKTTVWAEAVERAGRELWVLSARPAEAEAALAFGALADLLEPVPRGVFEQLPGPQRHALAVALLREEPGPRPVDQRSVAAATLSVLRALAATRPVLLAVDDLQWLDLASAHVLGFVLRRLGALPVGTLACLRASEGRAVPFDPGRALASGRCA